MSGFFAAPNSVSINHLVDPVGGGSGSLAAFLGQALSVLLMENVILGTFNLIPLPPLDGSAAIGVFLPEKTASAFHRLARSPQFSMVGLLVAWLVFPRYSSPLFSLVIRLPPSGVSFC